MDGGALGVGDDLLVGGDGFEAVTFVLEEVGDFEAEEVVVGVLVGEAALDDEGFGVAGFVAEEDGEDGAGFDGGDDAVGDGLAELGDALFLLPPMPMKPTMRRTQRGRLATANCWMPMAMRASA